MRSRFRLFTGSVKHKTRRPLSSKPKLESLEDRTLLSADLLVGSITGSPVTPNGVIDLNGTHLLSIPWNGQIGTDFFIPQSFGEVATGSQGDIFFVGPYQGQDGVFKYDHSTDLVSRVLATQYDRIALGPGDSIVGLLIPRVEIFPLSYSIQRDGQTVLTLIPKSQNPDPNALDNSINDVAVDSTGDIFFTGIYQDQGGVFKIDQATNSVSRVLTTSYQRIAIAPNGDIVGSGISQTADGYNAFIDVNGIRNVTLDNTTSLVPSSVAVDANQTLFFTGTYGGQTGVFRIDNYRNTPPAGTPVRLTVTQVSSTLYNNIAIEQDVWVIQVSGSVFVDYVVDRPPGPLDYNYANPPALAGVTVYDDLNFSGHFEAGDPFTVTDANGHYTLTKPGGVLDLNEVAPPGYTVDSVTGYPPGFLGGPGLLPPIANFHNRISSSLLSLEHVDPHGWVQQNGAGKSPAQAAHDYWDSANQWGREVNGYYQSFLHRDADAAGGAHWFGQFAAGASEATVIQGFLTSAEYNQMHAGHTAFVDALYQDLLGRSADAAGEAFWVGRLAAGASEAEVVQGFLQSTEAVTRVVDSLYAAYLHRQGETAGMNFWVQEIQSGRETLGKAAQGFLASPEFRADAAYIPMPEPVPY
jgi:hypothetical protein